MRNYFEFKMASLEKQVSDVTQEHDTLKKDLKCHNSNNKIEKGEKETLNCTYSKKAFQSMKQNSAHTFQITSLQIDLSDSLQQNLKFKYHEVGIKMVLFILILNVSKILSFSSLVSQFP
jgi:hypothetical protein